MADAGYVFGCYTGDGWHVSPRYYGTGETFVFQLEVRELCAASQGQLGTGINATVSMLRPSQCPLASAQYCACVRQRDNSPALLRLLGGGVTSSFCS